tara:strand:+ start:536 stop:1054 length:519 start_codon:yes stop_codon:yes gene_type:complete
MSSIGDSEYRTTISISGGVDDDESNIEEFDAELVSTQNNPDTEKDSLIGGELGDDITGTDEIVDIAEESAFDLYKKYDVIDVNETYSHYHKSQRKTSPYLSEYEKTLLVGIRRQHIADGAVPLIDFEQLRLFTIPEIVDEELRQKKIPLMIRRYLPNHTFEDWRLEDLHYIV